MKKENKKELLFLEDMGFDEEHIGEIKDLFVQETIDTLNENSETVKKNIKYLKDLGISNYQDGFLRFSYMFLMEPNSFMEIFSKYDQNDLIAKLEKNIAIMEHL